MKHTLTGGALAAALLCVAPPATAAPITFDFHDPKGMNAVSLAIDAPWEPVVGYADGISGTALFDPAHPEATTGIIVADVSSVRFSNAGDTQTARFYALEGKKYPRVECRLRKIKSLKTVRPGVYTGTVLLDLTCHGVTRSLTAPLSVTHLPGAAKGRFPDYPGDLLVVRCRFAIRRADFNIAKDVPGNEIGDQITVGVAIVGTQHKPVPAPSAAADFAPRNIPITLSGQTYSLAERMAFHHVPGVSVAVIRDFRLRWVGHYGAASAGEPVTDATRYMAGSMAEPCVAAATLKASEAGRIGLDAPIRSLLTSWEVPASPLINPARPITVRDLLTHRSGFAFQKYEGYVSGTPVPSVTDVLNGAAPARTPPARITFAPGSRYANAMENYTALQQVLVDTLKQQANDALRELLFTPLGMVNSTFALTPKSDTTVGHDERGEVVAGGGRLYPESLASGLWTTPRDFAVCLAELLRFCASRGGTYLKPETAKLLLETIPESGTTSPQTMGFGRAEHGGVTYLYRGGNAEGFFCHLDADATRGNAVIVFANGNLCWRLTNEIRDSVAHTAGFSGF